VTGSRGRILDDRDLESLLEQLAQMVETGKRPSVDFFAALMKAIRDELDGARSGSVAIATDLARALLVTLLRAHLEQQPKVGGILALLAQRATARAVLAMLDDPCFAPSGGRAGLRRLHS
jgi:hypothetical protein